MPDVIIKNERFYNPVDYVLKQIGGTWKVPVLWRLKNKALRYSELEKDIPHISQKMLTKTLNELHRTGLVEKEVFATVPPKVVYSLTARGNEIIPLIDAIRKYGLQLMKDHGIDYEKLIDAEKLKDATTRNS